MIDGAPNACRRTPSALTWLVTLPPGADVRFVKTHSSQDRRHSTSLSRKASLQIAEIIKTLGEGGMGAAGKARDVELEREVALEGGSA